MAIFACVNCDHIFDDPHIELGDEYEDDHGETQYHDDVVAGDFPVCEEMTPGYET